MPNKSVMVSRRTLTKGQAALYELTTEKVAKSDAITLNEAVVIWSDLVCRNTIRGEPAGYMWRYDRERDKYTAYLEVLTDEQIQQRSIQWLMQSIGALVMKGYLKITPMVKLID